MTHIACEVQAACQLGEGPLWDPVIGRLYWFDIKARRLHWFEPASRARGGWDLPLQASAAARCEDGVLLLATERGLARFDPSHGSLDIFEPLEPDLQGYRSNEGKIDLEGGFWWSVMDDDGGRRPGRVYRKRSGQPSRRMADGIHITNTLTVSPDGRRMYLADSAVQTLYAYELEPGSGSLGERRVFARTDLGAPDGGAVDQDGFLWNAQWGAWRLLRYAPDGAIDQVVEMPVEQPSSCAFGGADLSTLYITSAREGLEPAALARQPLAGSLFSMRTQTPGLALPRFAGPPA
jgi:sugar lactone lactonase YvrE